MVFDFTNVGEVKITMYQYLAGMIKHVPSIDTAGGISSTPAPSHLCEVRDPNHVDTELLDRDEKKAYHTITA